MNSMTLFMVDVSRHQVERSDPLDLGEALKAGVGIVNIQLDRGRQDDVLPPWAATYAQAALRLGMGVCTYKWLDSRTGGAESARRAFERMRAIGGPDDMAHVVDCEEDATQDQLRAYVTAMTGLLGRPIAIYTGRWWLQPRGWQINDLTPFLHAAPTSGYQAMYAGDESLAWQAGYGGWEDVSILQYGVRTLPGTGACSVSAIRDPEVWARLTTMGGLDVGAYEDWVRAGQPVSGVARPVKRIGDRLKSHGYTVYYIGNSDHLTHKPPEDHTPFSATGWPIASPRWWIFADDIMPPQAGSGLPSLQQLGAQMLADAKAGHPGMKWLKYMNWEPDKNNGGRCFQERFTPNYEQRLSTDRGHIHQSCRSDMKDYAGADDYDPVARLRGQQQTTEDDMQPVLVRLAGEDTVRLVTMGIGHIPVLDPTDLNRWKKFMSDNAMNTTVFDWPAASRPQCGPDLTAVPSLSVTPEVAASIAATIVAAGSNDLSEADLDTIKELTIEGAKQAAREGTGESVPA